MKAWSMRVILAVVLLGAAGWGWKTYFPSPENVIRKRLMAVAQTASVQGTEGNLAKLAKVQSLANYFTQDVEIAVDVPGYHVPSIAGRDELLQLALAARSRGEPIQLEIVDVSVIVAPDGHSAEARFTGKARLASDRTLQAQAFRAKLLKLNRQWLIQRVEAVAPLR
jgi:hypothetical protein